MLPWASKRSKHSLIATIIDVASTTVALLTTTSDDDAVIERKIVIAIVTGVRWAQETWSLV